MPCAQPTARINSPGRSLTSAVGGSHLSDECSGGLRPWARWDLKAGDLTSRVWNDPAVPHLLELAPDFLLYSPASACRGGSRRRACGAARVLSHPSHVSASPRGRCKVAFRRCGALLPRDWWRGSRRLMARAGTGPAGRAVAAVAAAVAVAVAERAGTAGPRAATSSPLCGLRTWAPSSPTLGPPRSSRRPSSTA